MPRAPRPVRRAVRALAARPAVLALVAALSVAAAAGLGVAELREEASQRRELSAKLLSFDANLQELHALGIENVTPGLPSANEFERLLASRRRARETLMAIVDADPALQPLFERFGELEGAGTDVLALRATGELGEARRVLADEAQPTFIGLQRRVVRESEARARDADRAEGIAGWVGGALLAVALALIAALFFFTDRARGSSVRRVKESEALQRAVVSALEEAVTVLDSDGRVVSHNAAAERILGLRADEIDGGLAPLVPTFYEDGRPVTRANSPNLVDARPGVERRALTLQIERPDGSRRWVNANYKSLAADGSGGLVCSFADVTEQRENQAQIAYLAYHDSLTGLPNRVRVEEHLGPALARARREAATAALVCIDLDGFKIVNDTLGHAAGDEVLREIAERFASRTRAGDLLARQGGDEFLVLLPRLGSDPADVAGTVARDMVAQLERPLHLQGSEFEIGASAGISLYPRDGEYADELLKNADAAMYQAKRAGKGSVAFYSAIDDAGRERLTVSSRLRRAIAGDELTLHYQPVFDLATEAAIGVEALIRWNDPERGLVAPAEFIPIAEETGRIEEIGRWVIERACEQAREWQDVGLRPLMGVNVSPRQLLSPLFVDHLAATLLRTDLEPARLVLEITESTAMGEPDATSTTLRALDELGVHIAIDDFGADFSSLTRLAELPVDVLKIDRSFLERVPADPQAAAMVTSMIALGHALTMSVVAEGVETDAQRAFLRAEGCSHGQGFGLARPAPAAQVRALLFGSVHHAAA